MSYNKMIRFLVVVLAFSPTAAFGAGHPPPGAVYVMSNSADENKVFVFDRDSLGRLSLAGAYSTAGKGSGGDNIDPLASQGALLLSPNRRWLFAVNAGSNEISVFRVQPHGLVLAGDFDSGGSFPTSLALYRNLLYVLNANPGGEDANITGFQLNHHGELTPIPGSTRLLGPGGYHQVGFTSLGDALVVTQGAPDGVNAILVFGVNEEGIPDDAATVSPSSGVVPFAFAFDRRGHLLVAEAGSGAVSSYAIQDDDSLQVIDGSVPNGNRATCWIVRTWFGAVFTANTASSNISSYRADIGTGQVQLQDAAAASSDTPIDMAVTPSGRYLYAHCSA
jgi:6-phosphogluconolactonase (cycloisomerase 2 family)